MAENNNMQQPMPQEAVEQENLVQPIEDPSQQAYTDFVNNPAAPADVPGPSTPERQMETDEADRQKKLNKQRNKEAAARIQSKTPSGFAKQPTPEEILEERRLMDAEEIEQAQVQENLNQVQRDQQNADLLKYIEDKKYAEEKGIDFNNPEMEELIRVRNNEELMNQVADEEEQIQAQERIEQASNPTEKEIERSLEPVRQQRKQQIVQETDRKERELYENKFEEKLKEIDNNINKKLDNIKDIDPQQYWNNMGTGQKVLMALSLAMSTYGAAVTGSENVGLKLYQQAVENNIKKQLQNNKIQQNEVDALRDRYHQMTQNKLKEMAEKRKDAQFQARVNQFDQQIQLQRQQLAHQMLKDRQAQVQAIMGQQNQDELIKRLSDEKGLSREDVTRLSLNKDTREIAKNAIYFKDGKARIAQTSPADANKLRENLNAANASIKGINRLLEINEQVGKSIDITGAKAEAKVLQQALKGNLRLELFGPGVMTDFESKMADKIIADPTNFFSLSAANRSKLNTLLQKLHASTKDRLRQRGIEVPMSENEKKYESFKAQVQADKNINKDTKAKMLSNFLKDNPISVEEF